MNLLEITELTEPEARQYLANIRWPNGPVCPHCGNTEKVYVLKGKTTREGLYKCGACRKQFTVTVGTVMQDSHLTCKQWITAFHLMCSSKKGISALQLQRELGMKSYESAWFLAHRIRAAMEEMNMLSGTVEVDETYVGGKHIKGTEAGRGTKKTPVMAMISRNGIAESRVIERANSETLRSAMKEVILPDSRIVTDEYSGYNGTKKHFKGGHETVNHHAKEYSRGDVHVNNAESYFSLLKRGVHGTFHHVSKKHLGRYCHEFSFRWNRRKINDGLRCRLAILLMENKILTYKKLIEKP
jgi:transposase-like protein